MSSSDSLSVPILLIGFNRPAAISKVFDRIRMAEPQKLYMSIDGARKNKKGESDLVNQVKEIVKKVDWPCETYYKFHNNNKGAEVNVSSAVAWVLSKEEYTIVLEDDIIAPLSFFRFMAEMLIRYKDDNRVAMVSGFNNTPIQTPDNVDYFFAKSGHIWGWGTWQRCWKNYNLNMEIKEEHLNLSYLRHISNSEAEAFYYQKLFKFMHNKGIGNNTWDAIFYYYRIVNNVLSIIPRVNLTSNIGTYGLHARGIKETHFLPTDDNFVVNRHPEIVECCQEFDIHHFDKYLNRTLIRKAMERLYAKIKLSIRPPQI